MAFIIVTGEAEFESLLRDLDQWSKQRNVTQAFEDPLDTVGRLLKASVQAHVLATSSKHQNARRGRRSLRKAIARATEYSKFRHGEIAGVTVKVNPYAMGMSDRGLPKLYEGVKDWAHPVYGHTPIVKQAPHPYFGPATSNVGRMLEHAGEAAVDKIADDLEG